MDERNWSDVIRNDVDIGIGEIVRALTSFAGHRCV